MKIIIWLFFLILSTNIAAEERELLLGDKLEIGGFGSPVLKLTNIKGNSKILIGGQAALLINNTVYLGGGGGGTARDIGGGFSSYSYGGLLIGSFIQPHKALHYFIDLGVYAGNLSSGGDMNTIAAHSAENFLILEPGVGIALNIMEYSKLTLGISYKVASSVDRQDISEKDVGGYSINGSVLFGSF